jgi:hypothetical protein
MPYLAAAEKIAAEWSATGFSRGGVMGADKRKATLLKDYFGSDYFPRNDAFPRGRDIAIANYSIGLRVDYVQGRVLAPNQRTIFWHDLGLRMAIVVGQKRDGAGAVDRLVCLVGRGFRRSSLILGLVEACRSIAKRTKLTRYGIFAGPGTMTQEISS